jgi:hypothetical protein
MNVLWLASFWQLFTGIMLASAVIALAALVVRQTPRERTMECRICGGPRRFVFIGRQKAVPPMKDFDLYNCTECQGTRVVKQ